MITVEAMPFLGLILVVLAQTAGLFYWAGTVRALLQDHSSRIRELETIHPRFGRRATDQPERGNSHE